MFLTSLLKKGLVAVAVAAVALIAGTAARADTGFKITNVVVNSPADIANLKPGQTILEINGAPVKSKSDLSAAVALGTPLSLLMQLPTGTTLLVKATPAAGTLGISGDVVNTTPPVFFSAQGNTVKPMKPKKHRFPVRP
jgi:membrane-associated protease RseP (regulator of RpoE activity)